jgi:hypothetical protein
MFTGLDMEFITVCWCEPRLSPVISSRPREVSDTIGQSVSLTSRIPVDYIEQLQETIFALQADLVDGWSLRWSVFALSLRPRP